MKTNHIKASCLFIFIFMAILNVNAQTEEEYLYSAREMADLRAAVVANPDSMELNEEYLAGFAKPEQAEKEYAKLITKFPNSAVLQIAIANKLGDFNPKRKQYLLRAAEIDPSNVENWENLASDAAFKGNKEDEIKYIQEAIKANPESLDLKARYVFLFSDDADEFKLKANEFIDAYPNSEQAITIFNIAGIVLKNDADKIQSGERMLKLFPDNESLVFLVAVVRLIDSYIMTEEYDKAIELAMEYKDKGEADLGLGEKLTLAQSLKGFDAKMKAAQFAEAKDQIINLRYRTLNGNDLGSLLMLKKAMALDANKETQAAFDSLIILQAYKPSLASQEALYKYGAKLNKSNEEVDKDVYQLVIKQSKEAKPFSIDSFDSEKKVTLEDLKGKITLLTFWYPACGPCRGEMPHFENAIKGVDREKFQYLGINIYREQDNLIKPFLDNTGFSFTPLGASKEIKKDYQIVAAPTNFIIDQEGRIVYSDFTVDAENEQMLTLMIESLMK
ncbi:Thiol-disulfide oxidoreductase resA [Sphingobacterium mizutaii]|uniref:Thiol-disulfide oxidoreductase resA n=2 Tax=Sphingobacterium mizutaii TaxID=1010 RepID=A0AAJ5BZW6_9SPHI|nr:redoxin domain-containing protein [Sphingobacterium mizutaii]SDK95350.1 Thiol-disulfide isomerase or thioredoxin [Sphingobacterium mizutaii]SNV48759.1 Thiol-disulfide oxidoreductase resA [Sphingobacterium mizutaii]